MLWTYVLEVKEDVSITALRVTGKEVGLSQKLCTEMALPHSLHF